MKNDYSLKDRLFGNVILALIVSVVLSVAVGYLGSNIVVDFYVFIFAFIIMFAYFTYFSEKKMH
jgi:accessory gene regulator protein AgrB